MLSNNDVYSSRRWSARLASKSMPFIICRCSFLLKPKNLSHIDFLASVLDNLLLL